MRLPAFVHDLWRLLPVRPRRTLYAWLSAAVAPRPDPSAPAKAGPPWIVAGVLRSPSGLGQTARLALSSLRDHGPGASAIDLTAALMQPASLPEVGGPDCPEGPGTILLYVTPPNIPRALAAIGRKRLAAKRIVAVWVWELERLPDSWVEQAAFTHEIAAPTHFAAEAIARSTGRPVHRLRYPLALEPRLERLQPVGPFKVGFAFDIASTEARKNPWDLIQAFEAAFGPDDDALLSIKTRSADYDRHAWEHLQSPISAMGPRAELFCEDWSRERTLEWMASLDLYASLHRSEGFGLTLAEAMHQGVPVLATDWSATAEFIDAEVGFRSPTGWCRWKTASSATTWSKAAGRSRTSPPRRRSCENATRTARALRRSALRGAAGSRTNSRRRVSSATSMRYPVTRRGRRAESGGARA